jgi:hypothetical protein
MKKIKSITIIGFIILFSFSLEAQVPLPYFTGFENASQQAGWTEYQKAEVTFCHWYLTSNISHSFAPSSGIILVDNWFVSPPISIINGGKLDSIRYMFSGYSQPVSGDTIGIYLLNGSPDPSLASSKLLLFDFRGAEYIIDNSFQIKTNILLPASSGLSYLAIRYRNADCSHNWLTVSFDNIALSGNDVGIDEFNPNAYKVNIYPNPAKDNITIKSNSNIKQNLEIYNMVGQSVYTSYIYHDLIIDISNFPKGVYFIKINTKEETITRKFAKE